MYEYVVLRSKERNSCGAEQTAFPLPSDPINVLLYKYYNNN